VRNIHARGAKRAIDIVGLPELPIRDVTFDGLDIVGEQGVRCVDANGVRVNNAKIVTSMPPTFQIENAQNVSLTRACPENASSCVELSGARSQGVTSDGAAVAISDVPGP
jgi:hypothetical protein